MAKMAKISKLEDFATLIDRPSDMGAASCGTPGYTYIIVRFCSESDSWSNTQLWAVCSKEKLEQALTCCMQMGMPYMAIQAKSLIVKLVIDD